MSKEWGIYEEGFSNGVAYGDLDNDGDLDLVINNLNDVASVFKNQAVENSLGNYIKLRFKGPENNPFGIGAKVWVTNDTITQYQELTMTRGFQSSVPAELVFGLGESKKIKKIRVEWPDGNTYEFEPNGVNETKVLDYKYASVDTAVQKKKKSVLFEDITQQAEIKHLHKENSFDDYRYQVLLPHNISEYGPALAVGDINNDALDDFYIGASYGGGVGQLYTQQADGTFVAIGDAPWKNSQFQEDTAAVFFDVNADGLQDLYVVSGGNEYPKGHKAYQDRLYLNKGGGGKFQDAGRTRCRE